MGRGSNRKIHVVRALSIIALVVLCGCYEEEDETLPAAEETEVVSESIAGSGSWLETNDEEKPLAFVARVTGGDADRIALGLARASALYRESPRMIANRVVQLWQEVEQKDDRGIDMAMLLDDLTTIGTMPKHSLGAVIQQYRVMRAQGLDHATAITAAIGGGP